MTSILLYHIYPINNWREITEILFQNLPFQRVVVHVSLPNNNESTKVEIESYFKYFLVDEILYSKNNGKGEVDAMRSFVRTQELEHFDVLTYMHCKGVSKPDNKNILEWTKLMRYFIIEKRNICKKAFHKGFITYGVNKSIPDPNDEGFRGSNFYYAGNFISLNLRKVNIKEAVDAHLEDSYYGLEGFWGKLCTYKEGFEVFKSGINHYLLTVPEKDYTTVLGRLRYSLVKCYYLFKSHL